MIPKLTHDNPLLYQKFKPNHELEVKNDQQIETICFEYKLKHTTKNKNLSGNASSTLEQREKFQPLVLS